MKEVIHELKGRVGVRGALVMTHDGVVVASDLGNGLDSDSVAALASAFIGDSVAAAKRLSLGTAQRVTLSSNFGRLVFVPFEELVLVVLTEPTIALEMTLLEIAGPARRIQELSRLDTQW